MKFDIKFNFAADNEVFVYGVEAANEEILENAINTMIKNKGIWKNKGQKNVSYNLNLSNLCYYAINESTEQ